MVGSPPIAVAERANAGSTAGKHSSSSVHVSPQPATADPLTSPYVPSDRAAGNPSVAGASCYLRRTTSAMTRAAVAIMTVFIQARRSMAMYTRAGSPGSRNGGKLGTGRQRVRASDAAFGFTVRSHR